MTYRRSPLAVLIAAALLLALPAAANAEDRFASPGGTATDDCTDSGAPCSIERAINTVAQSGDDITLLPGTYTTSTQLGGLGAFNRTVHGAPGARPTINFTATGHGQTGVFLRGSSVIRDVVIESAAGSGGTALFLDGGTIERVSVHETGGHVSGSDTRACGFNPGTVVRDTVCWYSGAGGANATALLAQSQFPGGTATVRNVTAVATNAPGIRVHAAGSFGVGQEATMDVTGTNVIAKGGGAVGQEDVRSLSFSGALRATATFDHSNYAIESEGTPADTITDPGSGTNQVTPPVFVNATTGDFHQQPTSTGTIDLGTASGLLVGELDFEGQMRNHGPAPDIGADELPAPPPPPMLTGTNPASPANSNNPLVQGTAQDGSTVDLWANGICTGAPLLEDQLAADLASPGLPVSVADNSSTTFSAIATNGVGPSACSTVNVTYVEVTPSPPISPVLTPAPAAKPCKKGFKLKTIKKKGKKPKKKCVKKKKKKRR